MVKLKHVYKKFTANLRPISILSVKYNRCLCGQFGDEDLALLIRPLEEFGRWRVLFATRTAPQGAAVCSTVRHTGDERREPVDHPRWLADMCAAWTLMEEGATECLNYNRFRSANNPTIALFLAIPAPY